MSHKLHLAVLAALVAVTPMCATTLQVLTLDTMIGKCGTIVRGHATPGATFQRGAMIYTSYQISVTATLKGNPVSGLQVAVPGGQYRGLRQSVAGAPALSANQEYVIFVWTSPSGANYIIGLSQGLFEVHVNASGVVVLTRGAVDESLLEAASSGTNNGGMTLLLTDLQAKIAAGAK